MAWDDELAAQDKADYYRLKSSADRWELAEDVFVGLLAIGMGAALGYVLLFFWRTLTRV